MITIDQNSIFINMSISGVKSNNLSWESTRIDLLGVTPKWSFEEPQFFLTLALFFQSRYGVCSAIIYMQKSESRYPMIFLISDDLL